MPCKACSQVTPHSKNWPVWIYYPQYLPWLVNISGCFNGSTIISHTSLTCFCSPPMESNVTFVLESLFLPWLAPCAWINNCVIKYWLITTLITLLKLKFYTWLHLKLLSLIIQSYIFSFTSTLAQIFLMTIWLACRCDFFTVYRIIVLWKRQHHLCIVCRRAI